MLCPKCRLINPDSSLVCDCGYDFSTGVAHPGPTVVSVSAAWRWVVAGLLANMALGVVIVVMALGVVIDGLVAATDCATQPTFALWVVCAISQVCAIALVAIEYKLAVAIGETRAWVYVVVAFVPVASLIMLIILTSRTWAWLRAHGGYRMRA